MLKTSRITAIAIANYVHLYACLIVCTAFIIMFHECFHDAILAESYIKAT